MTRATPVRVMTFLFVALSMTASTFSAARPAAAQLEGLIPVDVLPTEDILPTQERSRWLGCSVYNTPAGLIVRDIRRPSFAEGLGLEEGDLIYAIEGRRPRTLRQLHRYIFLGPDNMHRDVDIIRMGRHVHAVIIHSEGALDVVQPAYR